MSFLNLWALWIAAAAIPALLILYFLKLRRREEVVPSTFLWKRAVQDLQVNAPFQKLRKNLLLLLQLLVLLAGIFALARPIVRADAGRAGRLIILIDRSASMNALEEGGKTTRLELAKEQARRLVRTLNQTAGGLFGRWFGWSGAESTTRAMLIAFSDRASVLSPFTTNTGDLTALIDAIRPTDARTNLADALQLAQAYMQPQIETGVSLNPVSPEEASKLVLLSDGGVADLDQLVLRHGTMEMIPIGKSRDNVGITALRISRNYERPELLNVFVQVRNFGEEAVATDLSIRIDGVLIPNGVRTISLDPSPQRVVIGTSQPADRGAAGDMASIGFELVLERGGVLEAVISRNDALAVDNRAYAVVPAPRKLRVLLVSQKNFFLESVLTGLPLEQVKYLTPAQYEAAPAGDLEEEGRSKFDVVIFDKHETARLPIGNYWFIAAAPRLSIPAGSAGQGAKFGVHDTMPDDRPAAASSIVLGDEIDGQALTWWDETHAVLRHVVLEYVYVARWRPLRVPDTAERLIEGPAGPVLVRWSHEGRQFLVLNFAIEASNWWARSSFPVFVYNAIRYIGSDSSGESDAGIRPGDTLTMQLPAGTKTADVFSPGSTQSKVVPDASGVARFGGTEHVGIYRVKPGIEGRDVFAVNLEEPFESDIRPHEQLSIGGQDVRIGKAIETATPEVWRWFVGAALAIVIFEWWVYNRRVMI